MLTYMQEDMKEIAKQGLDVVWRLGLFLIQSRLRKAYSLSIKALLRLNYGSTKALLRVSSSYSRAYARHALSHTTIYVSSY